MLAHGPDLALSTPKDTKTRPMGSRRIFPPLFKLQVLQSYRHDPDCKGNQRATARKFNIHRRQIQKWLQCEKSLQSLVAESLRQDVAQPIGEPAIMYERRSAKIFKHEARTLKLVAQRLYPSSLPGAMLKDQSTVPIDFKGEFRKTSPECFVPKEYQLNDTPSEASDVRPTNEAVSDRKFNMDGALRCLNLKDDVSGPKLYTVNPESKSLIQKYSGDSGLELSSQTEPSSLGVPSPPVMSGMPGGLVYPEPRLPNHHPRIVTPSHRLPSLHIGGPPRTPPINLAPSPLHHLHHMPSPHLAVRPIPAVAACSPVLPLTADEPYNLVVKSPAQPVESSTLPESPQSSQERPPSAPTAAVISPLPAKVTEISIDSKTSAFSPKRKWLQDSIQDKFVPRPEPLLPPKQRSKQSLSCDEPKIKRPCPDFSIERLCGNPSPTVKTETVTPPIQPDSPNSPIYSTPYPPPIGFPPPLLLPNRTIPDLVSLHFKPDISSTSPEPELMVKEESLSEDEEPIDVISTTPVENKTFDFSGFASGKRRSFSVQFKLNVLDAFYNDKECNKNQRATARKFNINRRQVQKWLSLEPELRNEGYRKKKDENVGHPAVNPLCAQCPQHCVAPHGLSVSVKHCSEHNCLLSDLKTEPAQGLSIYHGNVLGWVPPVALPVPNLPYVPFYNPYDYAKIY